MFLFRLSAVALPIYAIYLIFVTFTLEDIAFGLFVLTPVTMVAILLGAIILAVAISFLIFLIVGIAYFIMWATLWITTGKSISIDQAEVLLTGKPKQLEFNLDPVSLEIAKLKAEGKM